MILQLITIFFGWLVLLWASINLVGLFVRGIFSNPDIDKMAIEGTDFVKELARNSQKGERRASLVALVFIVGFLIVLYYFWNIWVVIIALIIMMARIPDLLWEIKHGRAKVKQMPAVYHLTTLVTIVTLPLLWYVLQVM